MAATEFAAATGSAVRERRRHRRYPRVREVAVFCYQDERARPQLARGRVSDLSASGAAIREASSTPPPDTIGELTVYFNGFELVSEARVVRSWDDGFAIEYRDAGEIAPDDVSE